MENEIVITDDVDSDKETYRLALESVYRWTWRTDEQDPMDIIRAIKKVAAAALRDNE